MSFHTRLRRFARKQKAIVCGDPDGVLAVLQITKRLVGESLHKGAPLSVVQAMDHAIPMASPKDPVRARHYTLRILMRHTEMNKSALSVLADAIAAQGKTNQLQAKGPRA